MTFVQTVVAFALYLYTPVAIVTPQHGASVTWLIGYLLVLASYTKWPAASIFLYTFLTTSFRIFCNLIASLCTRPFAGV